MTSLPWRVIGASVAGTSHRADGVPCQDAHAYRLLPNGALVVAVADGAGTAARAEEGSRLAAEHGATSLENAHLDRRTPPPGEPAWRLLLLGAFWDARVALDAAAAEAGIAVKHFSTTLTCAVAAGPWLAVGQIGDGAVVGATPIRENGDAGGALFTAVRPRRGEYANEVRFLTAHTPEDALDEVEVRVYAGATTALALTTDGLLRLALRLPGHEPHAPFFRPLFAFVAETEPGDQATAERDLAAFLATDRINARTDDDKTLVLAARALPSSRIAVADPAATDAARTSGR